MHKSVCPELNPPASVHLSVLERIHFEPVQFTLAERAVPAELESASRLFLVLGLPDFVFAGQLNELNASTEKYLSKFAIAHVHELKPLFEDLCMLAGLFAVVSDQHQVKLNLSPVQTDMCRKFHTDINELRMLCTYVGPGTELIGYSREESKLWKDVEAENMEELGSRITHAQPFTVLLMKGALYRGRYQEACLHRSPPLKQHKNQRLLLRIDGGASFI